MMTMVYFAGLVGEAAIWLLLPVCIFVVFPALRKKHRSYIKHLRLLLGISELKGYPPPISGRFHE